jgi:hypothetical protein
MIGLYLARAPDFTLVIRETALAYGLSGKHYKLDRKTYWGSFDSSVLKACIQSPALEPDAAHDNLVQAWANLHARKDVRTGEKALRNGRKFVDLDEDFDV